MEREGRLFQVASGRSKAAVVGGLLEQQGYNHHETASARGMMLTLKSIKQMRKRRKRMTLHGLI